LGRIPRRSKRPPTFSLHILFGRFFASPNEESETLSLTFSGSLKFSVVERLNGKDVPLAFLTDFLKQVCIAGHEYHKFFLSGKRLL